MLARCVITTLTACLMANAVGCTSLPDMGAMSAFSFVGNADQQTIQSFSDALEAKNPSQMKSSLTPEFYARVFPNSKSMDDLALLQVPTGEIKIISTDEVSDSEKDVKVEVGESKRKMLCKMTSRKGSNSWKIDEVYLSQRQNGQFVTKSITEQMQLLTSIRDFTDIWSSGDREKILASIDPNLRTVLEPLPPVFMARLNKQLIGSTTSSSTSRPTAEINRDNALVTFNQPDGKLIVSMRYEDGNWIVNDLSKETRDKSNKIDSLEKRAMVINRSLAFLKTFEIGDKKQLAELTTPSFYKKTIAPSNPNFVTLPSGFEPDAKYEINEIDEHADFILELPSQIVRLKLNINSNDKDASGYAVDDVTIYDMALAQEKKLGALLTATSVVNLYHDAYNQSNMAMLRNLSTSDFNQQVWNRLTPETFRLIPARELQVGEPEIVGSDFRGRLTEVTVKQGDQELVYLLRERADQWLVDDIQAKNGDQLSSMKERLALLTPIYEYAFALNSNNLGRLRSVCSEDFRRRVWLQAENIPYIQADIVDLITQPVVDYKTERYEALVSLGTPQKGAQVHLTMENGLYQINDAMLPTTSGTPVAMKQAMRMQLAYGNSTSQQIATVSGFSEMSENPVPTTPIKLDRPSTGFEGMTAQRPAMPMIGSNGSPMGSTSQQVFHAVYKDQEDDNLLTTPLNVLPAGHQVEPQPFKRDRSAPGQIQHPTAKPMPMSPATEPLLQSIPVNYR